MADGVELVPVNDRDEAIFRAWEDGKGPQALSREFALPIKRVEEIIDRMLPVFDAQNQLRAFKRELRRLEDERRVLYDRKARQEPRERSPGREAQRACAMRGIGPMNMRMDPLEVEVKQQPTQYQKIADAINQMWERLPPARRAVLDRIDQLGPEKALEMLGSPHGNASPPSIDCAVDTLAGAEHSRLK